MHGPAAAVERSRAAGGGRGGAILRRGLTRAAEAIIARPDRPGRAGALWPLLKALDGRPVRSRYGPAMEVRAGDLTNWLSLTGHPDYDDVFAVVDGLRTGEFLLDIGANAGLFSLVAARRVGPTGAVLAFEPSPPMFAALLRNAAANRVEAFHPFNVAIGDSVAMTGFDPGSTTHSGVARLDPAGARRVLQVTGESLDALVGGLLGERTGVVKIDVEGAEQVVVDSVRGWLAGPGVRRVVLEVDAGYLARFGGGVDTLYATMAGLGFTPTRGVGAAAHYNEVFDHA